ncbi:MAG: monovalent cation/H(+) antiporter subunit G [Pseudochelatococcus sp.]|jgi:multicomponent Na+:H+ antiporter subunit G|uniref:monovalent cation/H(+) antiporter subunit G n=1 Tax=Pseudochelatococcus sp. TaxID=2020869 RepID=UPI003D92E14B
MHQEAVTGFLGDLAVLAGAFLLFSAGLGVLRMPDPFTRIQAGAKTATLGSLLVMAGIGLHHPAWALKLAVVAGLVFTAFPLSAHVIARAAHRIGTPMKRAGGADETGRDA